jgi:hypothetical protein
MKNAVNWLNNYQHFWSAQLDRLAALVEDHPCSPPSPASYSSAHQGAADKSLCSMDGSEKNDALVGLR